MEFKIYFYIWIYVHTPSLYSNTNCIFKYKCIHKLFNLNFTHLKLCLADAIHNYKWVKII